MSLAGLGNPFVAKTPSPLVVAVLLHAGPRFLLPILELQDWVRVVTSAKMRKFKTGFVWGFGSRERQSFTLISQKEDQVWPSP